MGIAVSSYRYRSRRSDESLREQLVRLAREKPRYGYRRLQVLVEREGERVNHKRLWRVYREAGLCLKRKKRRHCVRVGLPRPTLTGANQEWALDFVHDVLAAGRNIRVLSVVDAFTRECLALEVDTGFASRRVTRVLDEIIARRGRPQAIRCDNVLTREGLAERKKQFLNIPYGMETNVTQVASTRKGGAIDHSDTRSEAARSRLYLKRNLHQVEGRNIICEVLNGLYGPTETALPLGAAASWKQRYSVPDLMIPHTTRAILAATAT